MSKTSPSLSKTTRRKAKAAVETVRDTGSKVSPNPMTNLIIADLALRGGGQLLRHAVERTVLGTAYGKDKAKDIVKGRSMVQTLVGTALARIATRSVPGAILVGGGMLAKALYDRRQGTRAKAEGKAQVNAQADKGADKA